MARPSLWYLQNLPFLSSCDAQTAETLRLKSRVIEHPSRSNVPYDDRGDSAYLITSGAAKLVRHGWLGRRILEALLVRGDFFGSVSRSAASNPFILETTEPVVVLAIPTESLLQLVKSDPRFAITVIQSLEQKQRELRRNVENLLFKNITTRVAQSLQWLAREHGDRCEHGWAMDIRINQQDLADLCGASRQAVSGVLGKLERRFVIRRTGRVICILSMSRLAKYANAET